MRIFVSYRREDSSAWAGRLRDGLAERFGDENVFLDVDAVRPGQNFTDAIDGALDSSDAVFVVIGPNWRTASAADGSARLADANDYVRYEVSAALVRHSLVVPVLVGGAEMPPSQDLPEDLEDLTQRQAVTLHDVTWRQDVGTLIERLPTGEPTGRRVGWRPLAVGLAVLLVLTVAAALILNADGSDPTDSLDTTVTTAAPESTMQEDPDETTTTAVMTNAVTTTAEVTTAEVTTAATPSAPEATPAPLEPPAVSLAREYSTALANEDWNTVRYLLGSEDDDDYWFSNYQYLDLHEIVDYEIRGRVGNAVNLRVLVLANESVPGDSRTSWYCFDYRVDVTIPDIDSVAVTTIDRYPGFTTDWSRVPPEYISACENALLE